LTSALTILLLNLQIINNSIKIVIGRAKSASKGRFKTGHLRRRYLAYSLSVKEERYGESTQDGYGSGDYRVIRAGLAELRDGDIQEGYYVSIWEVSTRLHIDKARPVIGRFFCLSS